jgi:hypothetical protein
MILLKQRPFGNEASGDESAPSGGVSVGSPNIGARAERCRPISASIMLCYTPARTTLRE